MQAVHSLQLPAGFCYTQFAGTYQETNGLLYPEHTPKFPIAELARATRGSRDLWEPEMPRVETAA